tara:strand:+ start:360 stop:599 length:240 start_codon:yes stop_codon:yes gene_type:complete
MYKDRIICLLGAVFTDVDPSDPRYIAIYAGIIGNPQGFMAEAIPAPKANPNGKNKPACPNHPLERPDIASTNWLILIEM